MVVVMVLVRHCSDVARQVAQLIPNNQAATEGAQPVLAAKVEVRFWQLRIEDSSVDMCRHVHQLREMKQPGSGIRMGFSVLSV